MSILFNIKKKHLKEGPHDDSPSVYVLTVADKLYEIDVEYIQKENVLNPEDVFKPDYEFKIENFMPDTICIVSSSLRSVDNKPLEESEKNRLVRLVAQHFEKNDDNLKVMVE